MLLLFPFKCWNGTSGEKGCHDPRVYLCIIIVLGIAAFSCFMKLYMRRSIQRFEKIECTIIPKLIAETFYIHIAYYEATFYYTLDNYPTLQNDAMGAKINDSTVAIT